MLGGRHCGIGSGVDSSWVYAALRSRSGLLRLDARALRLRTLAGAAAPGIKAAAIRLRSLVSRSEGHERPIYTRRRQPCCRRIALSACSIRYSDGELTVASVFRFRNGWRAQANAPGRPAKNFRLKLDAERWAAEMEAGQRLDKEPWLGGPTKVTLAQLLDHYGRTFSLAKDSRVSELNRVNHYLAGAGMPLLKAHLSSDSQWEVVSVSGSERDAAVAPGWKAHLQYRRDQRKRTYDAISALARRRVSTIRRVDIKELMATMEADGLSESTVQKEVAMLKVVFNTMVDDCNWVGFENPCARIPLGKSNPRFVNVSDDELARLYRACAECDSPWFLALVDCAIFLTARSGSLLELRWEEIAFQERKVWLRKTKTGPALIPLPLRTKLVLEQLPRHPSGYVFPMSKNAVAMAWEGVREKAGLPNLQFRDLRHLGGTHYAKRVPNAHMLREILGHKTLHMAQVYVNLAADDIVRALDTSEPDPSTLPPVPARVTDSIGVRKARRLNASHGQLAAVTPLAVPRVRNETTTTTATVIEFPSRHEAGSTSGTVS